MASSVLTTTHLQRLAPASIIWFATVRPDASPHLTPIWFVLNAERIYVCTSSRSVKARNLQTNPRVSLALEDGIKPLVIEGKASQIDDIPGAVADGFREKYDWDIGTRETYDVVIEFVPEKILMG